MRKTMGGSGEASSALLRAASALNVSAAKAALEAGALPDCMDNYRRSPLMIALDRQASTTAIIQGAEAMARLLLDWKADPRGTLSVRMAQLEGDALMRAAGRGLVSVVEMLCEAGADPSARDGLGRCAAWWALKAPPGQRQSTLAALLERPGWREPDDSGLLLEDQALAAGLRAELGLIQARRLALAEREALGQACAGLGALAASKRI